MEPPKRTTITASETQMPMPKPMSESTTVSDTTDRAAIERWEGEGGRALRLDESQSVRPDDLEDASSFRARAHVRAVDTPRSS